MAKSEYNSNKPKEFLNVKQVQDMLGISRNQTYKLFTTKGFPCIQIGKRRIVEKDAFYKYLKDHEGSRIYL